MLDIELPFPTHMVKWKAKEKIFSKRNVSVKDFVGQKMAERLFQVIIGFFGVRFILFQFRSFEENSFFQVIGFIAGYVMQQFSMAVYSVLFGVAVAAFVR